MTILIDPVKKKYIYIRSGLQPQVKSLMVHPQSPRSPRHLRAPLPQQDPEQAPQGRTQSAMNRDKSPRSPPKSERNRSLMSQNS